MPHLLNKKFYWSTLILSTKIVICGKFSAALYIMYFMYFYSVIKEQFYEVSRFEITNTSTEKAATMTPSN